MTRPLVAAARALVNVSDALIETRGKSWGYDDVHVLIENLRVALKSEEL